MQQTGMSGRSRLAIALTGLAGLLLVIGAILPFLKGSAGGPFEGQTSSGLRYFDGKVDLGVGVALMLCALVLWAVRSMSLNLTLWTARPISINLRRVPGMITFVLSAFIVYASIVDIADIADLPQVDIGVGLYVILVGSIIGVVGGVLSLMDKGLAPAARRPPAESSTPPPDPETPSEPSSPWPHER